MLIQLYDYGMSSSVCSFNCLSCEVTNQFNDVATATIKCIYEEIKDVKSNIDIGCTFWLDTGFCQDIFFIKDTNLDDDYLTLSCEQLGGRAEQVVCYYADPAFQSSTEDPYSLWDFLFYMANSLSAAPSNTYLRWTDRKATDANYWNIMMFYKDADGNYRFSDATHYPVSTSVLWQEFVYDANGKTLKQICDDFITETGVNVVYLGQYIFFTELSNYELFTQFQTKFSSLSSRFRFKELKSNKQLFSRQMSSGFSIKAQHDNFCAAVMPLFTMEKNNRAEKETTTQYLTADITATTPSPQIIYSDTMTSEYGWTEEECRHYIQSNKFSHEVEWNRYFNITTQIYGTVSTSTVTDIRFDTVESFNQLITSGVSTIIPIYNIFKQKISEFTIRYATLGQWVTIYDSTGAYVGQCNASLKDSTKKQYNIAIVINYIQYGASVYGQTSSQPLTAKLSPYDKPQNVDLVDPFGNELGELNFENWTESMSTTSFGIFKEVEQDSSTTTTYATTGQKKMGVCTIAPVQTWSAYWVVLRAQIVKLASAYVNSWLPDSDLQSVSVDLNLRSYELPILINDIITLWVAGYNNACEFLCSSTTWNCINSYYTDLEIGYKRSLLNQINKNQKKLENKLIWK